MKKQILNIGKALNRAEQKEVFGGNFEEDVGDGWAQGLCLSLGTTMNTCSSWPS